MASSWGLAHGKTGVIVTAGEAIASKVPGAVTTTATMDIPAEGVLPRRMDMRPFTAPDPRITMAVPLTPQWCIQTVVLHIATALTPQSFIPVAETPIAAALTPKSRITVVETLTATALIPKRRIAVVDPLIAAALTPRSRIAVLGVPLMVVVNRTAVEAANTNRSGLISVAGPLWALPLGMAMPSPGRSFRQKVSNMVQMAPFRRWYSSVVWTTMTGSKVAVEKCASHWRMQAEMSPMEPYG
jgi:hypothetical protein